MKDIFVYGLLIPVRDTEDMKCGVAKLNDYELVIADSGHFSVVPKKGSCVYGVVFSVDEGTLSMYDAYEGYNPSDIEGSLYIRKEDARVELVRFNGDEVGERVEVLDGTTYVDFYMQQNPFFIDVEQFEKCSREVCDAHALNRFGFACDVADRVEKLAKQQGIPTEQYKIALGDYGFRLTKALRLTHVA